MTQPQARTQLVCVATMFFINGALFGAWASRVPTVKALYALSDGQLGLLLLLLAGGAVVSFPLAGRMIDQRGSSQVAIALAALNALALVAIGLSPGIVALALALVCFGASHGGMDVAMNAYGGMLERRHSARVMSRLHAVWSLGAGCGALSGVLAGWLGSGLAAHFVAVALLMAALALWLVRPDQPSTAAAGGAPFALPRGSLLLIAILAFCASMGEGAMADWSAVYLTDALQTSASLAASGYAVFSIAMVITRLCGDWIIGLAGQRNALQMAGISATAGTAALVFGGQLASAMIGFVLMGIGYALVMPIAFSRAANDPHISAGSATAATATLGYGGMLLGPPIIGFIANASSLEFAFSVLLLGAAAILLLARPATRV